MKVTLSDYTLSDYTGAVHRSTGNPKPSKRKSSNHSRRVHARTPFIPNPDNKSPLELAADRILESHGDKIVRFGSRFIEPRK